MAVDARAVYSTRRRGTGKNLVDLYRRVARLCPDWQFVMLHRQEGSTENPFAEEPNVRAKAVEMKGDRWDLWQQLRLPLAARGVGASVLHSPANTAPAFPLVPLVVTIHDLIPVQMAPNSRAAHVWARKVGRGARLARRVITPSAYTKDLLVHDFGVPAEKVVVNHWAPDGSCRRVDDPALIDQVRVRYGLVAGQRYVFGFGAADPRKNTMRILEAWAGLGPARRAELALLIVGLQEPFMTHARERAAALAPQGGYALMPFAAEPDLPALISGAAMLCYPSLSEGFGLPILDAFACGTPVITSRTTSLPEVAGGAALLVDPYDVTAIREAMVQVMTCSAVSLELRERGYARLQEFSWDRCAQTAAAVLREAA